MWYVNDMKKKLYIRFFDNKEDLVPHDSSPLLNEESPTVNEFRQEECWWSLVDWMNRHPNGKVDFVWL